MIYYVVLLLLIAIGIISNRKWTCILSTIILTLLAGLRGNQVGADTVQYQIIFENYLDGFQIKEILFSSTLDEHSVEMGFNLLQFICHLVMDYNGFKFLCACMTIIPVGFVIYKYSIHPGISFVFFFMLPIYTLLSMSAMRQGIAFGIFLLAMDKCFQKKIKSYFILIFLATQFHSSAIILIPLYVLNYIPYKKKYDTVIIAVICTVALFSSSIFHFLSTFSRIHYESGEAGGWGMLCFLGLYYIAAYFVPPSETIKKFNCTLRYLLVFTILCWLVGMNLAAIFRLAAYTEFFIVLYISNVLSFIPKNQFREHFLGLFFVGTFIMMNKIALRPSTGFVHTYVPYFFFWE